MTAMAMRPVCARPSAFLACAAGALISCAASAQVQWRTGADPAIPRLSRAEVQDALTDLSARGAELQRRRVVVQFSEPVDDAQRARLSAAGLRLLSPLGDNAFFASLSPAPGGLDAGAIAAERSLYSVRAVREEWKLDTFLQAGLVPEWAVVNMQEKKPGEGFEPVFGVYVTFHGDVDLQTEARALAARYGAFVRDALAPVNALVLEIPQSQVRPLASEDAVMWVEPAIWQFTEGNASNRERTGVNVVNAAPYGLSGAGVSVMVFDGGTVRATHVDFQGRATNRDAASISDHATHVSGTIGGAGVANPLHRGMAPGVTIQNYGFQWPSGDSGFLYTQPGDLLADYTDAVTNHGVVVTNNSIGNNTAPNNNPCDWQGNYGTTDTLIDAIARGSIAGRELIIVWANGNERQTTRCQNDGPAPNTGFATLAPPANAKNHITVGALNSNDDSMTTFSSWGPSDDGRMKPDVSAPGSQNGSHAGTSDGGVTSCSSSTSNTGYSVKSGTSMAAPTVTGIVALMLEDFRSQFTGEPDPSGSTIKVLLAHNAVDLGNVGPDYKAGYGSVRAQETIDFQRTGNFIEGEVGQGGVQSLLVLVNPGETFKATLAWNDPPATLNAVPALINNLDLRVFDPNGVRRYPWTLNPAIPNAPAERNAPNTLDNLEQVMVGVGGEEVPAGVWRVEVVGTSVPTGPQRFSLAASPLLINCSTTGVAALDRAVYSCSTGTLNASVTDCDLNLDDDAIETIMVLVTSGSEPGGEVVVLTETGAQTADFRGSIPLTTGSASGALSIAHGDTISFTYLDADDGFGGTNVPVTAMATVDCQAPFIHNVAVTNLSFNRATVTFTTTEPARASVSFGTSCAGATTQIDAPGFATSHAIEITGLSEDTVYFFTIGAADAAGNAATNNNGGSCHTFRTEDIPNYFTELFLAGERDTAGHQLTFTPNNGVDFYRACFESIASLPTDPAGGTVITFPSTQDDQFLQVTPGTNVSLYGVSYPTFFVASNGYITFTAGSTTFTESITSHFSLPRIAALFDDLHPGQGGQVSWKALADRVAVTWLNVPEYNAGNQNTFQIEMHTDGTVRIAWLNIAATDGLSGLSAGGGTPAGFLESDLSTLTNCAVCPADIDGDGDVDFADLNTLLASYGQAGPNLPGDLDGDGDVDFNDLNIMLGAYGLPC
ncbi:MAG: S8 family serine peptidase [Phycisphaerales bacterium]|nr:S8 family serine peptidase [Phycisphaerales bacterium]